MTKKRNGNRIIQWMVVLADFLLMNGLLFLFLHVSWKFVPKSLTDSTKLFFLIANFSMIIAQYFFHSIIHIRKLRALAVLERVARLSLAQAVVCFFLIKFLHDSQGLFNFFVAYTCSLYLVLMVSRYFERKILGWYRSHGGNTRTVIFVGNDPANVEMYMQLVDDATMGYHIVGYYSNGVVVDAPKDFQKIGDIDHDLMQLVKSSDRACDDIFCSLSHDETKTIVAIMRYCDRNVIHFFYVPRQFGNYRLHLKPEYIGDIEVLSNYNEPLLDPLNKFIKRAFDIIFSLAICIIMLPFIPIIALIIKIQSPGPVFFRQKRTGLNGETFVCYKFRSMDVNPEADTDQATKNDPRKFPFGNFMRKSNIDELPQFFNVLKGDMSVVGPRPHMLHHTEIYSKLIDKYMVRHFFKPGITGWAQVTGYRGETKELWQMEERVRRDIWYIEHWSFWLDIKIILMTIADVFKHDKNAY